MKRSKTNIRNASARQTDKLRYRYPQGESYEDVIERLNPLFLNWNEIKSVLLIAHQIFARSMHILQIVLSDVPYLSIPLHTVIQLTPKLMVV